MVPILYWVKRQRARHELGVAKGSVVWDRPGGERGAGPETDVTTISRITRPHVSGRDFQRDRLAQAASCSSDSRAGRRPPEKRRGESIGDRTADRDQLATSRSGSYRNAPVRVTKTALQAGGLGLAAAMALLRFRSVSDSASSGFRSVSDSATRADRNLARSLPGGMNHMIHDMDGWRRSFWFSMVSCCMLLPWTCSASTEGKQGAVMPAAGMRAPRHSDSCPCCWAHLIATPSRFIIFFTYHIRFTLNQTYLTLTKLYKNITSILPNICTIKIKYIP